MNYFMVRHAVMPDKQDVDKTFTEEASIVSIYIYI